MFMRFKMRSALKTIKTSSVIASDEIISSFDPDVLSALEANNCIDIQYADNRPCCIYYRNEAINYILARSEVWTNRVLGFVLGVISSLIVKFISSL
jgi:hypothetical protein